MRTRYKTKLVDPRTREIYRLNGIHFFQLDEAVGSNKQCPVVDIAPRDRKRFITNSKHGYQVYRLVWEPKGIDEFVIYLGAKQYYNGDYWYLFSIVNNLEMIELARGRDAYTTNEGKE